MTRNMFTSLPVNGTFGNSGDASNLMAQPDAQLLHRWLESCLLSTASPKGQLGFPLPVALLKLHETDATCGMGVVTCSQRWRSLKSVCKL